MAGHPGLCSFSFSFPADESSVESKILILSTQEDDLPFRHDILSEWHCRLQEMGILQPPEFSQLYKSVEYYRLFLELSSPEMESFLQLP